MGKSYYCDYCDKSFKSDPVILKKHLNGMQHQIARKAYYAQFKCMDSQFLFNIIKNFIIPVSTIGYCNNFCLIFFSIVVPKNILRDEFHKKPCVKFESGECRYGALCRFSHYTRAQLETIRKQGKSDFFK